MQYPALRDVERAPLYIESFVYRTCGANVDGILLTSPSPTVFISQWYSALPSEIAFPVWYALSPEGSAEKFKALVNWPVRLPVTHLGLGIGYTLLDTRSVI